MKRLIGLSVVLSMVFAATSFAATAGDPPGGWNRIDQDYGSSKAGKLTDNGWSAAAFGHGFNETLSANSTTLIGDGGGTHADRLATDFFDAAIGGSGSDYTYEMRARFNEGVRPQINYRAANGFELRHGVNGGLRPGFLFGADAAGIVVRHGTPIPNPCPAGDTCFEFADSFPGVDLTEWFVLRLVSGLDENNQAAPGVITAYLSVDGTDDTGHQFLPSGFGSGASIQIYADTSPAAIPEIEIDYLRIGDGAAIPEIPEPATMALIGLGSFLLLRRRHRA